MQPPRNVFRLRAVKNQVLLATFAQKYPTPCTTSFWTPDRERRQDSPETTPGVEATGLVDSQENGSGGFRGHFSGSYGGGGDGDFGQMAQATPIPESLVEKGEGGWYMIKIGPGLRIHPFEWETVSQLCHILKIVQDQRNERTT